MQMTTSIEIIETNHKQSNPMMPHPPNKASHPQTALFDAANSSVLFPNIFKVSLEMTELNRSIYLPDFRNMIRFMLTLIKKRRK
jgi:hypothetical protein